MKNIKWLLFLLPILLITTGCINIARYHPNEINTIGSTTINLKNTGDAPSEVLINEAKIATLKPGEKITITIRRLK